MDKIAIIGYCHFCKDWTEFDFEGDTNCPCQECMSYSEISEELLKECGYRIK